MSQLFDYMHICIYAYMHICMVFETLSVSCSIICIYACFLKPYMHSEHLGPVLSAGAAIWALRYHFFAMYRILSTQAAFCRQVSHSERLGSISSTCIAFWAPRQRFVDRCRILTSWATFLQQVFPQQMRFYRHLSHFERPGNVSCTLRWSFLDRCRVLCTSVLHWFSMIFLEDSA